MNTFLRGSLVVVAMTVPTAALPSAVLSSEAPSPRTEQTSPAPAQAPAPSIDRQVADLIQSAGLANGRAEHATAERLYRQALGIAERGNDTLQVKALSALGFHLDSRGRLTEAVDCLMRAVAAADRAGDVALRVRTRLVISVPLIGLSRYDEAHAAAEDAYDISRQVETPSVRATALFALAQAYNNVWNLDRAAALWPDVIAAYRQAGSLGGEAVAVLQSVNTWFALGDFDRAVADGEKTIELLRKGNRPDLIAETQARLALSEARRGRLDQAAGWSDRARHELPGTPEARHLFVHNDLGLVAIELRQFARAKSDFSRVLQVAEDVGNVEYGWRGYWGLGRTAVAEGRPVEAVGYLETAIPRIERLRQTIPAASLRAAFMTQRVGPYETLVEALMAQVEEGGDDFSRKALHVAERARSRALADLLAEARGRLVDPRIAEVRARETAFGQRFSEVQRRTVATRDPQTRAAALAELQRIEQEYETLLLRNRRENPAYAALAHPRALPAEEISAMLADDEAIVEFLLGDRKGFAWVVRRNGLRGYSVPGSQALAPRIRLLHALLTAGDRDGIRTLGTHLHKTLLGPAWPSLANVRRLIVVPDGVLLRVPFSLLRADDRWLIETHSIAMAPSATVLDYLRRGRSGRAPETLLAFAAPQGQSTSRAGSLFDSLPSSGLARAAEEIRGAADLLGVGGDAVRIGPAASESSLKRAEAGRYQILHFATHAVVDESSPRRSAVLLGSDRQEDGLLQINEIANLSLNADLVVLAACRSQVGRLVRGEGFLSLSRAFMHAGARAIVASLWAVDDRETSWLIRQFYAALKRGMAPDAALREAQLAAVRAGGTRAEPQHWAAFTIMGDASRPLFEPPPAASLTARFAGPIFTLASVSLAIALLAAGLIVRRRRPRRGAAS